MTIHPSDSSRNNVEDPSVLDFDMLQTGHSDRNSIPKTVNLVTMAVSQNPTMPVLDAEVCYEGIMEASRQEVQRFMFWTSILSGAAGHTYGANGIWQVNTREQPFGPSPHGRSWGDTPWEEAYQLPGSKQLGLAKNLLMRYPWWRLEPHARVDRATLDQGELHTAVLRRDRRGIENRFPAGVECSQDQATGDRSGLSRALLQSGHGQGAGDRKGYGRFFGKLGNPHAAKFSGLGCGH